MGLGRAKVIKVNSDSIEFDNGILLGSYHEGDCCEEHYLCFKDLTLDDFDGLQFELETDGFFERVPGYGIALLPVFGHPVRIPGYGYNNGYYSADLALVLSDGEGYKKVFDITECQLVRE